MSDSNVYTAEKILEKREHRGITQYLIKWKGYSRRESTWEPVENILDPELLTSFVNSRKSKRLRKSRTSHVLAALPDTTTSPLLSEPSKPESTSTEAQPKPDSPSPEPPSPEPSPKPPVKVESSSLKTPPKPESPSPAPSQESKSPLFVAPSPRAASPLPATPPRPASPLPVAPLKSASPLLTAPPKPSWKKKFAVMNTVITDVTVNNRTITISESKSGQFFFKEVSRKSVDATTQF